MIVSAMAKRDPHSEFETVLLRRRDPGPRDVVIDISYAGICHTDVHRAHGELGTTRYPIVPGHEIAGVVSFVGAEVRNLREGDHAGIGCMVESCGECDGCRRGLQQYCREGHVLTYNATDRSGRPTYGGYSQRIVVDSTFAVKIPDAIPLERAAPLMCAGITLYSPLRRWGAGPGRRVAIAGFGGLGHVGTQIAAALGAHTTVLNLGDAAREDALRLGADEYRSTTDPGTFAELGGTFDLIVSTVPVASDIDAFLGLLAIDGTLVNLGVPPALSVVPHSLLVNRRSLAGSLIGGMAETQEMLEFCAEHGIAAETEVVAMDGIDKAYSRLEHGDVRYRFVLDVATMPELARTHDVLQLAGA